MPFTSLIVSLRRPKISRPSTLESIARLNPIYNFLRKPTANASVKNFVDFDGWYNGTVVSVINETVNVKLENDTEEQWSETAYTGHREADSIEIGEVGYKFVVIFDDGNLQLVFNGKVELIRADGKQKCWYYDNQTQFCMLVQLNSLSKVQYN